MQLDYEYIAYIDEAGDDGLQAVKPLSKPGSSEWLILAAVVARKSFEAEVDSWSTALTSKFKNHQRIGVHFADLNPSKRLVACQSLLDLPVKIFVVASNKKNMEGYENPIAAQIPSQNWFYCWMTRVLLERVTHFVRHWSLKEFNEPKKLRIEYSARGGLSYSQMGAYYEWMRTKHRQVLPFGKVYFDVLSLDLLKVYPHTQRTGLQMSDIAAGAFFKACDYLDTGACDPQFAQALKVRMASVNGLVSGYGLKLLPSLKGAKLKKEQEKVFRHYGYPKQWWDPEPFC